MEEFKDQPIEKIKNAPNTNAIDHIINDYIDDMKKNAIESYIIANRIRRLDISLLLIDHELSSIQHSNIKYAQKLLIRRIIKP